MPTSKLLISVDGHSDVVITLSMFRRQSDGGVGPNPAPPFVFTGKRVTQGPSQGPSPTNL